MAQIPHPPDCSVCQQRVGLWEVIVHHAAPDVPTTWLRLTDQGTMAGPVWHVVCVGLEPSGAEAPA